MITDFLKKDIKKKDAKVTLALLRLFKAGESRKEWTFIPLVAWAKVEQFEEFLEYIVNGKQLEDDTLLELKKYDNDLYKKVKPR